jgi:uncharacterized protein (DUF58 family)
MSFRWVSVSGWVVWSVTVACLLVGLSLAWREVVMLGVALALVSLLGLTVLRKRTLLAVVFDADVYRVLPGSSAEVRLRLVSPARRVTSATDLDIPVGARTVTERAPRVRAGAVHETVLRVDAPRRTVIPIGPISVVRRDPFGLYRRSVALPGSAKVVVHPATATLPPLSAGFVRDLEGEASRDLTDSDLSFHALREYVAGDDRRHIHWKSSAKTGRFMIRQYEQTRRSRMLIVLDTRREAYADDAEFELAVSTSASLGVRALRDSRDVMFVVSRSSVSSTPVRSSRAALQSVEAMSVLTSVSPARLLDEIAGIVLHASSLPLGGLTPLAANVAADVSVVFAVTGSSAGVSEIEQASLPFGAGVEVVALRCAVESSPRLRTSGRLTLGTVGRLDDLTKLLSRNRATA